MATNVITAAFAAGEKITYTPAIYQTDYGMVLKFNLILPEPYEVIFQCNGQAVQGLGTADGVDIPNDFVAMGEAIIAFVTAHEGGNDRAVVYQAIIPVKGAVIPTAEIPPEQQTVIDRLIAFMEEAREQTAADAQAAAAASDLALEHANDAQGYTSDAQSSAEDAAASALEASDSAGLASDYATNALNSKTAAQTAQGKAEAAQTKAETAQGKAEDAQEAAEQAKADAQVLLASTIYVGNDGKFYMHD